MIDANQLDVSSLPVADDLLLTDTLVVVRLGGVFQVSGEVLRARTRPHLLRVSESRDVRVDEPGMKVDCLGQALTLNLPAVRDVAGQEFAVANVTDPTLANPGSVTFVPKAGEKIVHPALGALASFTSSRPGDTFGLRAEVVPIPNSTDSRVLWLITRS